jgi:hypothetical protein
MTDVLKLVWQEGEKRPRMRKLLSSLEPTTTFPFQAQPIFNLHNLLAIDDIPINHTCINWRDLE